MLSAEAEGGGGGDACLPITSQPSATLPSLPHSPPVRSGREREVQVAAGGGVVKYEKRFLRWAPGKDTCCRIRNEMGLLSQLQVGEYIIQQGGSAGNFAVHSDGASSDGTELSAFVLGHRQTVDGVSKIRNLLFDVR